MAIFPAPQLPEVGKLGTSPHPASANKVLLLTTLSRLIYISPRALRLGAVEINPGKRPNWHSQKLSPVRSHWSPNFHTGECAETE